VTGAIGPAESHRGRPLVATGRVGVPLRVRLRRNSPGRRGRLHRKTFARNYGALWDCHGPARAIGRVWGAMAAGCADAAAAGRGLKRVRQCLSLVGHPAGGSPVDVRTSLANGSSRTRREVVGDEADSPPAGRARALGGIRLAPAPPPPTPAGFVAGRRQSPLHSSSKGWNGIEEAESSIGRGGLEPFRCQEGDLWKAAVPWRTLLCGGAGRPEKPEPPTA